MSDRWIITGARAPETRWRYDVLFDGENEARHYLFKQRWWESNERFRRRIVKRLREQAA